jgi:GTPase
VLHELGIAEKDTLYVLNKIDRLPEPGVIRLWQRRLEPAVALSARTGAGTGDLLAYIENWLTGRMPRVFLRLPLTEGSTIARVYKNGTVLHSEYRGADVLLEAQLDVAVARSLQRFSIPPYRKKHASGKC